MDIMAKILELKHLTVEYKNTNDTSANTIAVNDVSFSINEGEIYALAGESGCGKSTIAKTIVRLLKPTFGEIFYKDKSIYGLERDESKFFPQKIQMVFQNPYSTLNPKMKIYEILKEPLDINTKLSSSEKKEKITGILQDVGLDDSILNLYPHEFSGGQRQRIAIARALILKPELLVADEPVSALDASIQAQILNLLKDLKQKYNLTILFISHDMNVIRNIADKIAIMHSGKLIEEKYTGTVFRYPKEEYTKKLLNSIPILQN
ncbi:ABC transporter ATP-binding protein [bacterium]|nr:ABC transporter ATP-binding protein [bacterium]